MQAQERNGAVGSVLVTKAHGRQKACGASRKCTDLDRDCFLLSRMLCAQLQVLQPDGTCIKQVFVMSISHEEGHKRLVILEEDAGV